MRSRDLFCIFLKIKIKAYQVPFQNIYGLLWFRVQLVDELKKFNLLLNFALKFSGEEVNIQLHLGNDII